MNEQDRRAVENMCITGMDLGVTVPCTITLVKVVEEIIDEEKYGKLNYENELSLK